MSETLTISIQGIWTAPSGKTKIIYTPEEGQPEFWLHKPGLTQYFEQGHVGQERNIVKGDTEKVFDQHGEQKKDRDGNLRFKAEILNLYVDGKPVLAVDEAQAMAQPTKPNVSGMVAVGTDGREFSIETQVAVKAVSEMRSNKVELPAILITAHNTWIIKHLAPGQSIKELKAALAKEGVETEEE